MTAHAYRVALRRKVEQRLADTHRGLVGGTTERRNGRADAYADVLQLLTEDGDDL